MSRRPFGNVRTLPSGRFQARYRGPDGRQHHGPFTFATKADARVWLAEQESLPTVDLCDIMLHDSAYLQEKDVEFVNRIRKAKHEPLVEPLALERFEQGLHIPENNRFRFVKLIRYLTGSRMFAIP